jgi:hypothetical protein
MTARTSLFFFYSLLSHRSFPCRYFFFIKKKLYFEVIWDFSSWSVEDGLNLQPTPEYWFHSDFSYAEQATSPKDKTHVTDHGGRLL